MKRFWVAPLVSLILVCLVGCSVGEAESLPWCVEKSAENITNENENIVLQASDDGVTPWGIQLTLLNGSDAEISFGEEYFLQLHWNNSWHTIKSETGDWLLGLLSVPAGSDCAIDIDWVPMYGELPPGKYRIVKEYYTEAETSFVFCEFEIT